MFSRRIGSWSYGTLNGLKSIDTISDAAIKDGLHSIAFMNLKKTAGYNKSNYNEIQSHVLKDKELIIEEIELINPDIIIGGVTWEGLWKDLFGDKLEKLDSTHFKWNGIPILHFYHPSAPGIYNETLYDKLRKELAS